VEHTDITNASRAIKKSEIENCAESRGDRGLGNDNRTRAAGAGAGHTLRTLPSYYGFYSAKGGGIGYAVTFFNT
jgi:hypothetical protein